MTEEVKGPALTNGFPGETEDPKEAIPEAATETTEARLPWMVVRLNQTDAAADPADSLEGYEIVKKGFRLNTDADIWIRENINDNEILASMRMGRAFAAEVIRKVREL